MTVQVFSSAQLPATPWKNGGGTTQELVCHPAGADLSSFSWRISIAQIASDGPFSTFPGIDRIITLLAGDGVQLSAKDGSLKHRLDQPMAPFAFPGDVALDCALLGGPSHDFNVMARRGVVAVRVTCAIGSTVHLSSPSGVLWVRAGSWQIQALPGHVDCMLSAGAQDGVYWVNSSAGSVVAIPASTDAQLIVVAIEDADQ